MEKPQEKQPKEKKPRHARAARPQAQAPTAQSDVAPLSRYEIFVPQRMNRKDIAGAPYNAAVRYMDDMTKNKLRDSIKKGLFRPPVWNKRFERLVCGHQRIEQLDELHASDNYSLTVLVVDVDEKEEKRINLADNNQALMGQFNPDGLSVMLTELIEVDVKPIDAGFEAFDLQNLNVNPMLYDVGIETGQVQQSVEDLEKIAEMKKLRKGHKEKDRAREAKESLQIVITNCSEEQYTKIMAAIGRSADDDNFVPAWRFCKRMGIEVAEVAAS